MKKLIFLVLALAFITPAFAGEDPYIAIVGNDYSAKVPWYFSEKYQQFMFDQAAWDIPVCDTRGTLIPTNQYTRTGAANCEQFRSQTAMNQGEVCYFNDDGEAPQYGLTQKNAVTRAGNSGFYEWFVRLPKKPSGEINLVLQCGVLKPNTFALLEYEAIELCAAETGERIGRGFCTRDEVEPGTNPLVIGALPKITAIAYPGAYNIPFKPFNLTAFRNPGTYNPFSGDKLVNGDAGQVLNGTDSTATRILLKACMDKAVVTKLPVTGQVNALNQEEVDLEYGDIIYVRLDIPRANTVDVYCHEQSLKVMGIGEVPF